MKLSRQISLLSILSSLVLVPSSIAQGFGLEQPTFFRDGNEQFERNIQQLQQSQPKPVLTIDEGIEQWQPISSQAGGFSVWVPLGILSDENETVANDNASLNFRILSSQTSLGKFVVAYADAPDGKAAQLFALIKEDLVKRTAFKISSLKKITIDNHVGESLILKSNTEVISAYVLLANKRLYVVGMEEGVRNTPSEAATKFLKSFRLHTK